MEAALRTFVHLKAHAGRKVVILGDMLELGPQSEGMHRSVGAQVAAWQLGLFIAIGRQMAYAADVAETAGIKVRRFRDTAAAREQIRSLLKKGDQILLKGSHGMALETLLVTLKEASHSPVGKH